MSGEQPVGRPARPDAAARGPLDPRARALDRRASSPTRLGLTAAGRAPPPRRPGGAGTADLAGAAGLRLARSRPSRAGLRPHRRRARQLRRRLRRPRGPGARVPGRDGGPGGGRRLRLGPRRPAGGPRPPRRSPAPPRSESPTQTLARTLSAEGYAASVRPAVGGGAALPAPLPGRARRRALPRSSARPRRRRSQPPARRPRAAARDDRARRRRLHDPRPPNHHQHDTGPTSHESAGTSDPDHRLEP